MPYSTIPQHWAFKTAAYSPHRTCQPALCAPSVRPAHPIRQALHRDCLKGWPLEGKVQGHHKNSYLEIQKKITDMVSDGMVFGSLKSTETFLIPCCIFSAHQFNGLIEHGDQSVGLMLPKTALQYDGG